MPVLPDRWWRGLDGVIVEEMPRGSRIVDVGCGDGHLVQRLARLGLEATGVDPCAPAGRRLFPQRIEEFESVDPYDAACAIMSLHHADLDRVLPAIARLLRPGGQLFVYDFAWETYDERAAAWLKEHDASDADNTVPGWRREHAELHSGAALHAALAEIFDLNPEQPRPYLARMLGAHELEAEEQRAIDASSLPALGRFWLAAVGC
jgi:SAM-dependent methyltransferase